MLQFVADRSGADRSLSASTPLDFARGALSGSRRARHWTPVHLDPVESGGARRAVATVSDCAGGERRESDLVDPGQIGRRHIGAGAFGRDELLVELLPPDVDDGEFTFEPVG